MIVSEAEPLIRLPDSFIFKIDAVDRFARVAVVEQRGGHDTHSSCGHTSEVETAAWSTPLRASASGNGKHWERLFNGQLLLSSVRSLHPASVSDW